MNENCGCCDGIEHITPVTIANRPGLDALIYRVGTHASFLETMKARLSNLGIPLADLGASASLGFSPDVSAGGEQKLYPLRSLTTRASYDPAIALFDSWAVVADVLTFYQERIANEGYLRTATERRSILELARLVNYVLRPGVSASVFLAYTLEVGAETTIAVGNRAQSLPGPGETPQPFETADKLVAKAKWNNLQPRLMRPQFITQQNADTIDMLYFQGAATGLKPNDPLLLIFNDNTDPTKPLPGQFVRFVQSVEVQAALNRTKVTLQDIVTAAILTRTIQQTIARYLNLPTFCVSSADPLFTAANAVLQTLLTGLPQAPDVATIVLALNAAIGDTGTGIGVLGILSEANNQGDAHVANWLVGLVHDLQNILRRVLLSGSTPGLVAIPPPSTLEGRTRLLVPTLPAFRNVLRASAQIDGPLSSAPSLNGSNGTASRLPDLVTSLSKPVSQQPANSSRLDRSISRAFSTQSDILPQILATLNPALQPTLYPAVSNAAVTAPSDLQSTQALRVKSAPFGNNAPLKPITNDKGIVVGHEEWPIADTTAIEVDILSLLEKDQVIEAPFPQALISFTQDVVKANGRANLDVGKPNFSVALAGSPGSSGIPVNVTIFVARFRFFHAIFNNQTIQGPVDVYINNEQVLANISFATASDYLAVPPKNNLEIKVILAGQSIATAAPLVTGTITIGAGTANTFIAVADNFILTTDDLSPPPVGQAKVRANQVSHLGNVTVTVKVGDTIVLPVPGTTYQAVNAGTYELSVTVSMYGQDDFSFQQSIVLEDGKIHDIIVISSPDGGQIQIFPSSSNAGQGIIVISSPGGSQASATVLAASSIFAGEMFRYLFAFPQQQRELKVIGIGTEYQRIQSFILQDNEFSAQFTGPQTQVQSTLGRNIVFAIGEKIISISDESLEAVPQNQWKTVALDAKFDQVTPGSWVVIERPDRIDPTKNEHIISRVIQAETVSKAEYGISGSVTQLTLDQTWLGANDVSLATLRQVTVYAQSVARDLAEETIDPIEESICGDQIELDDVYGGLQTGRWLIVAGERTDILGSNGVQGAELVMLADAKQGVAQVPEPSSTGGSKSIMVDLPGDTTHTFLTLANALSYSYKRDTVTVYGNVVRATHGETRNEVLGSGDGSKELQEFALRQSPLTYLSAPTPAGAESTLKVYVNAIEWHETDTLAGLGPTDRKFITQTDDAAKTTAIFGNGKQGARLPTGVENVKATYRTGIGKPGNVIARKISLLATRPLGVKSVINPLPATGGADRESIDQARRNVPVAVLALDRLVSVQDYADFARTYAGIGKASAAYLPDGRRQLVHLTIAGADNIPIATNSDLYRNLFQALRQLGDPNEPLLIALADVRLLVIQASIHLLPDYQLESVEPQVRTALLNAFSFEQRELGQPVFQSEVISVIQGVAGVDYVKLEIMGAVSQDTLVQALKAVTMYPADPDQAKQGTEEPGEVAEEPGEPNEKELAEEFLELLALTDHNDVAVQLARFNPTAVNPNNIDPAQLAFLSPDVPDTLILGEIIDERQA